MESNNSELKQIPGKTHLMTDILLIISNLIPLLGVLFWRWDMLEILMLYWAESVIIGFFNLLKIRKTEPASFIKNGGFFAAFYGGFMFVHYIFLLVGGALLGLISTVDLEWGLFGFFITRLLILSLLSTFISHGVSYLKNFIGQKEYARTTANVLIFAPISRIMIMQVVILGSAGLMLLLQQLLIILPVAILVLLKTILDFLGQTCARRGYSK